MPHSRSVATPTGCKRCGNPHPRCLGHKTNGEPCGKWPMKGARVCDSHGGRAPQVREAARVRLLEARTRDALAREGVIVPKDVDPFQVIEDNIRDAEALRGRLKRLVDAMQDEDLRYTSRAGEQARAELTFFVQLLERSSKIAAQAIKLDLAERRLRIQERQVNGMLQALRATVHELGMNETTHPQLRATLIKHLTAVGAEVA